MKLSYLGSYGFERDKEHGSISQLGSIGRRPVNALEFEIAVLVVTVTLL